MPTGEWRDMAPERGSDRSCHKDTVKCAFCGEAYLWGDRQSHDCKMIPAKLMKRIEDLEVELREKNGAIVGIREYAEKHFSDGCTCDGCEVCKDVIDKCLVAMNGRK